MEEEGENQETGLHLLNHMLLMYVRKLLSAYKI